MSILNEDQLLGAPGSSQYQIQRSLRFNSADSAYLSRTPASAGNRKTWTWSGWVKTVRNGSLDHIFLATLGSDAEGLRFDSSDKLQFYLNGSLAANLVTTQVFRDHSSWRHIQVAVDTTQATASDRIKIYVNGSQVTAFSTATYPTQNYDCPGINTAVIHWIGNNLNSFYSSFYLADIHFIDGQALTPSSFGETDATTGEWIPKAYTGTYGTNGFKLNFADNSAATAAALGKDTSGNGNNWTPTNLSVTAGAGNDSLVDTPTSYGTDTTGVGGEVRGNYCTLNPLQNTGNTLSNGNLDVSIASTNWTGSTIAAPPSGKWYAEFTVGSTGIIQMFGLCSALYTGSTTPWSASGAGDVTYYVADGRFYVDAVQQPTTSGATAGDIISFALDAATRSVEVRKNNTLLATKTIAASSAGYIFYVSSGGGSCTATLNYGARSFAYTAPSGFKALCDTNLPAPTIIKPSTVMDVKLYTGNGSTQTISGLGFSPDLVWVKGRSLSASHRLTDAVRGAGYSLYSNLTNAEALNDANGYVSALGSDGFTVAPGSIDGAGVNGNGSTYAAWCWDAGSSTVTNTAGTISSQVRANASAGFSIVTWTIGSGSGGFTVGHGLGVTPGLIIWKPRVTVDGWYVWHSSFAANEYARLDQTGAKATSASLWNNTAPTSSVMSGGYGSWGSYGNMLAYCFAPVAGCSAFGSYTGNGSADGPFVYTGFRPRWVMIKAYSAGSVENWIILDGNRVGYNPSNEYLLANTAGAEGTVDFADLTSNGFKIRSTTSDTNSSAQSYIYAAFAEFPFQYARAR